MRSANVGWNVALALLYAVSGWVGLQLAIAPGYATAVFPASGLALAFVLRYGPRMLPGVFAGSLLLNWLLSMDTVAGPAVGPVEAALRAAGIGAGAALQAYAGYRMVRPGEGGRTAIGSPSFLLRLLLLGGPVASLVNATVGPTWLRLVGALAPADHLASWFIWWSGDTVGVVVFAPLVLVWLHYGRLGAWLRVAAVTVPVVVSFGLTVAAFFSISGLTELHAGVGGAAMSAWYILAVGLAFSGLLGALLIFVNEQAAVVTEEVARKTAELQRLNAELNRAGEAKSRFLANVSHELRTPLHGIVGYADLLGRRELPAEQAVWVARIAAGARDLRRIVDDLLDMSKVEAGRYLLEAEPFSLGQVAGELTASFAPAAEAKGLDWRIEVDPALADCRLGDALRLKQALGNIAGNAVKFTSGGWVAISMFAAADDPDQVMVRIADTGPGIPADHRDRVFEPFTQLDAGDSREHGGIGLGLAIGRRLVEQMGGTIELHTGIPRGAVFVLRLPLPAAVSPARSTVRPPIGTTPPAGSPLRVLLAEDNADNAELIRLLSAEQGYEGVDAVADGQAAVEACRERDYDVILMDMQLPGLSGTEATAAIRKLDPARPQPCIIGLSANAFPEHRQQCLEAGMDGFLSKPFPDGALGELLRHLSVSPAEA